MPTFLEKFTFQRYIAGLNGLAVFVHSANVVLLGIYHFGYDVSLRYTESSFEDSTHHMNKVSNQVHFINKEWTTVNPITLLMMNEGIALFSALLGFFNTINSQNNKIIYYETIRRWIEFALTASILEVVLLMCLGENDLFSLFSIFLLIVIQQITGYLVDTEEKNSTHKFLYFFIGFLILFYQQTFVIIKSMSATGLSDRDKIVLPVVNAVMYSLFGIHHYLHQSGNYYSKWVNKHTQFILLSFCTKTIVTWLTFVSLRHTVETIEPKYIDYNIDWEGSFNIILFVIIPFFVGATLWMMTIQPSNLKKDSKKEGTSSRSLLQSPRNPPADEISYTARDVAGMGNGVPMLGPNIYSETDSLL